MSEPISVMSNVIGLLNGFIDLVKKLPQQARYIVATLCVVATMLICASRLGFIQFTRSPPKIAQEQKPGPEVREQRSEPPSKVEMPERKSEQSSQGLSVEKARVKVGEKSENHQQQSLSGGTKNQQTQIGAGATLIQSGESGCNQNVIGGSYNTNNCSPQPIRINDSQQQQIALYLAAIPSVHGQSVDIECETTVEDFQNVVRKLVGAMKAASIKTDVHISGMLTVMDSVSYSGISLAGVWDGNRLLADSIDKSLQHAGVIDRPVKRLNISGTPIDPPPLAIIIRRP